MIATNCKPLTEVDLFKKFLEVTGEFKKNIVIYTARDKFHLKYFDAAQVVESLWSNGYRVLIQDYSNEVIALSEFNAHNQRLKKLNTGFSCCAASWTDNLGVLPDGGWTICPPSLEVFGNIFSNSLEDIVEFKRLLPLRCKTGCTECMKDFKDFRKQFELLQACKS